LLVLASVQATAAAMTTGRMFIGVSIEVCANVLEATHPSPRPKGVEGV
jgi:hypothetical protein